MVLALVLVLVVVGVVIVCVAELELVGEEAVVVDEVSACVVASEVLVIDVVASVVVGVLALESLEELVGVEVDLVIVSVGVVNSVV